MRLMQFQARRPMRSTGSGRRDGSRYCDDIGLVMLKIARVRYEIFRAKFGRDPGPDDPLFFASKNDQPVVACEAEMWSQVMDAAVATRSDYLSGHEISRTALTLSAASGPVVQLAAIGSFG
jgi:hypothetical protein